MFFGFTNGGILEYVKSSLSFDPVDINAYCESSV